MDDSWRCSKQISTATDDDGTLVNWIEVESPKTADELKAEFDVSTMLIGKEEEPDESVWTDEIPAPLVLYQYLEELPHLAREDGWRQHLSKQAYLSRVPPPPVLPRILDKVIVNAETKSQVEASKARSFGGYGGGAQQIGMDDNSILAVPNHVVLNHLTASAIKNGTLGVGTTTRYRKKVRHSGRHRFRTLTNHSISRPCFSSQRWQICSLICLCPRAVRPGWNRPHRVARVRRASRAL